MGKFILIMTSQRNGSCCQHFGKYPLAMVQLNTKNHCQVNFLFLQIYTFNDNSSLVPLPYEAI